MSCYNAVIVLKDASGNRHIYGFDSVDKFAC